MQIIRFLRWWLVVALLVSGCLATPAPMATIAPSATPSATPVTTPRPAPTQTPSLAPVTAPTESVDNPPDSAVVAVGDRHLFLACTGDKRPTVILEAGLDADHTSWNLVQPAVAQFARVCSYDRAGLGQSDPAPTPRTSQDVVQDLYQLLQNAGEIGPYILVGHSFGGLHVRMFAHEYPEKVIGVVLVDAVHEGWWSRAAALLPAPTSDDSPRLQNFRQFMTVEYADPAKTAEGMNIPATVAQLQAAGNLGKTPLLVLVAGIPTVLAPGLPPDLESQLNQLLQQTLPDELLALSSLSIRLPVDDSGHNIPQDQPDAVVVAIRTMIDVACLRGC